MSTNKLSTKAEPAVLATDCVCDDCGRAMKVSKKPYRYVECGLSSVTLQGIRVFECGCGVEVPEIPALAELHLVIACGLIQKETALIGEEVRFLRKMAGLTQAELARVMGVDETRPSKWESKGIPSKSDRFLRTICLLGILQQGSEASRRRSDLVNSVVLRHIDAVSLLKSIDTSSNAKPEPQLIEMQRCDPGAELPWLPAGALGLCSGSMEAHA